MDGVIDSCESCFRFLSRSIPIFPREQVVIMPGEKTLIPIETPFVEEISGMATVKIIDKGQRTPMRLKLKFIQNVDRKTMIGILDLRSLGYYKIKQGVLQQNLNKYYPTYILFCISEILQISFFNWIGKTTTFVRSDTASKFLWPIFIISWQIFHRTVIKRISWVIFSIFCALSFCSLTHCILS